MFNIDYRIKIGNYNLVGIDRVEVSESVEELSDSAVIVLPGESWNNAIRIEDKVKAGDKVDIWFGYDENLEHEFSGYVDRITNDNGSISVFCEDSLWLFKKSIDFGSAKKPTILQSAIASIGSGALDKAKVDGCLTAQLHNTTSKAIIDKMLNIVAAISGEEKLKLNCTLDVNYEKFDFDHCTPYDVLKKIQDDGKPDIYIADGVLHVHPVYSEIRGECVYSLQHNVESENLKYVKADDRKVLIKIEVGKKMKKENKGESFNVGIRGGEIIKMDYRGRAMDKNSIINAAKAELAKYSYDGYEGSITGWLIPVCHPSYSAELRDDEYEYKNGKYYVTKVVSSISASGGVREVTLGRLITK